MNAFRFEDLPLSNSTVASAVTLLVSGWFLVASGAILTDPESPYTQRAQTQRVPSPQFAGSRGGAVALADEARLTITVVARREAPTTL